MPTAADSKAPIRWSVKATSGSKLERRGQRRREHGPEAVDRVEREQDRDLQPRVLDRVVLVLVDQHRVGLAEHAADRLARLLRVLLHLPVGEQRQLVELLVERHPAQQVVDPPLDRRDHLLARRSGSAASSPERDAAITPPAPIDPTANTAAATADTRPLRDMVLPPCRPLRPDGRGGTSPDVRSRKPRGTVTPREVQALGGAHEVQSSSAALGRAAGIRAGRTGRSGAHGGGELREYAQGTWASFVAMTDEQSGLPADILNADGTTSVQTSTTNIGAYMWSAVAAERLGFIRKRELVARLSKTLDDARAHGALRSDAASTTTGTTTARARSSPSGRRPASRSTPILSSVDNGWLAVRPEDRREQRAAAARARAGALYDAMNFGFYYRPDVNRVLFHYRARRPARAPCCYDTVVSESRIVDYIGIARGQLPQKAYYGRWRTFPDTCDWSWTGDQAGRRVPAPTSASTSSRARYPYAGMQGRPVAGAAACSRR